ncbi:hypothetical protein HN903_04200 [archaeon]|jgi:hypothetical protein|nr:hypothetical protein [archaeon]MBT7128932.1 hypothetical protein [archaeon]
MEKDIPIFAADCANGITYIGRVYSNKDIDESRLVKLINHTSMSTDDLRDNTYGSYTLSAIRKYNSDNKEGLCDDNAPKLVYPCAVQWVGTEKVSFSI